jgi:WD40 repeat protein
VHKGYTPRLWDARTGQKVGNPMPHGADVFDPTGELLATGSADNTARLWNAKTGEPVGEPLQHGGPVWGVTFDLRGRFLATGSADSTARLWTASTGEPVGGPMPRRPGIGSRLRPQRQASRHRIAGQG